MRQKLLTKHCAMLLLALFATAWSTQAWAEIKIHVKVEGNTNATPYLYMWKTETDLVSAVWPGDAMTETITTADGVVWYVAEINESNFNLIINNNGNNQSREYSDIHGDKYYAYNSNTGECYNLTYQYEIPTEAHFKDGKLFVYFVNTSEWANPKAHVYNSSENIAGNWPGGTMTKVDNTDNLYVWEKESSSIPSNVIFSNNGDNSTQTSAFDYVNGGYYSSAGLITTITKLTLNSTNFPDANFRSALSSALGVSEGGNVEPNNVRILDVRNKGISNLTGIAHFTNLEELYAQDNNITSSSSSSNINVSSNTKLKILNVSNNSSLTHIAGIANCHVLEELYLDGIDFWPGRQISTSTTANVLSASNNPALKILSLSNARLQSSFTMPSFPALEYLNMSDNSSFNGFSGNLNLPKLNTIIFRNLNLASDALNATHFANAGGLNLKYLDVSDNPHLYNLGLSGKTNLETLIMKNCIAYDWGTLNYCPNLKHVDLSGCTGMISSMWDHLNGTNHKKLQYLNLSNGTTAVSGYAINFPSLDSLIVTNHNTITELNITGHCPGYIDVTNSTPSSSQLRVMVITNCGISTMPREIIGLMSNPKLYRFDLTDNQFTTVPEIACPSLTTMVMNNNLLTNIDAPSNVRYLYAQHNNFPTGEYVLETSLYGIDLGDNSFTKFKAIGNPNLKALALGNSPSLTEIELHENPLLTQTSPDGEIETDNGLYIQGLSNLQTLNIEHSKFNKLGQQNSLEGVTGLKTLKARYNEFTTFTNGVYALDVAGNINYRIPDPNESSLEYLTALEYLDLAYNNLQDSVHLYRNIALKHLDVSHNNEIHGVIDGTIDPNDAAAVEAMRYKKGYNLMKYGRVYGKDPNNPDAKPMPGWNPSAEELTAGYTNLHALRSRPFDLRLEDLNDTTGLYHLDLGKNVNLEWLDISYTNIHNTAAGPSFMNPGWMDKDWVTDMGTFEGKPSQNTTTHRAYMSWHTFVYIIPCSKLKTLHMDHNNMQSMGVRYFPELETLTSSYMYGDCALMRDFNKTGVVTSDEELRYGYGNTGLSGSVVKYTGDDNLTTNSDGIVTNLEGHYPNPTKYVDVSHSGFNSFHVFNGVNLEYLDVSYNPMNYNVPWNDLTKSYNNSLDVTYCPNIRTVKAENCSDLPIVRAHNRTKLDTLYLSNDPKLKVLYVQNDPVLKANFQGLNTLTGLETLFGYNNTQWGGIDVHHNTALKNLWVSNIGIGIDANNTIDAITTIDVSHNTALEKLRVYDNAIEELDVTNNPALTWLDFARNKVEDIDLSNNTALQYFNCSNSVETLNDLSLAADSHNGGEADEEKPVTASHSATDKGNSLSDLVFNENAPIAYVLANSNDLHKITGNFTNLNNIEFAHNHINGIDLSKATGTPTINSEDNGRAITAECAKFYQNGQFNPLNEITVFYFQLEDINTNGQIDNSQPLASKTSEDGKGHTRYLGQDGFILDELKAWNSSNSAEFIPTNPSGISPRDVTVDPSNMDQYLTDVPGRIVVLQEDPNSPGEGCATYTYNNGKSDSEFYLKWTADTSIPTAIENMKVIDGLNIVNTTDGITITGKDGTVVGVYDLNGRLVASETISGGTLTIDGLAPGIYVVNGVKVVVK